MTKILFFGDLGPSGFGTVTMDLGRELLNLGHDLRFMSQNEVDHLPEPFASRTFMVTRAMRQAALDAIDPDKPEMVAIPWQALLAQVVTVMDGGAWPDGWTAEACFVLGDYWGVSELVFRSRETVAAFARIPTFHYVPIEGVDLPPAWNRLWSVVHPVAMSEFGAEQIRLVTGERPPVVYHGIDTDTFRPVSADRPLYLASGQKLRSKEDCKKLFGTDPREPWVFRADRNMPRKRYASLFRALAPVMMRRPAVRLVIHCLTTDEGGHLADAASKLHPSIQDRVTFTGFADKGMRVDREILTALYNAADIYASPSAEGFGLTIAEAMACGTPAVGMDYSSVTEVIGDGGLLAPVNHLVDNEYDHAWAAVDEVAFGNQVAKLLDDVPLRRSIGRQARRHVVDKFSWAKAALQFSALIREHTQVEVAA